MNFSFSRVNFSFSRVNLSFSGVNFIVAGAAVPRTHAAAVDGRPVGVVGRTRRDQVLPRGAAAGGGRETPATPNQHLTNT
eukprot:1837788-Pyramimonas_sp.AAC.4